MVFSAISMVSSFQADNDTDNSVSTELKQTKTKNDCMHHCTILRCRKSHIQQSWLTQTEMEWSVILQSALTLWDLSIWGGGGRVLAVNVFASSIDMWHVSTESQCAQFQLFKWFFFTGTRETFIGKKTAYAGPAEALWQLSLWTCSAEKDPGHSAKSAGGKSQLSWRTRFAGSMAECVSWVAGHTHNCISLVLVVVETSHFMATRWVEKITAM